MSNNGLHHRPDTLFRATYMVLSPEHEYVENTKQYKNFDESKKYKEQAAKNRI